MYNTRISTSQNHRSSSVKKISVWVFGILLALAPISAIVYVQFFQEIPLLSPVIYEIEPNQPIATAFAWPDEGVATIGAAGYGLLESSEGANEQVPIASITKLFTALAIMREKPFEMGDDGEIITFGPRDEQLYIDTVNENGSSYPINNGEQLTQYDALQAMLIASANNVADSLVLWAFGSEKAYLEYVNTMVLDMGLSQTIIRDASGMSPETLSTAEDLMIVAGAVLDDPVLSGIVRRSQTVIDASVGTIFNTNQLLGEQFVVGVKTGTTDEAGANLIFAAEFPLTDDTSETIIGVTLGQPERSINTSVSTDLLYTSYENFGFIEVIPEGTVVGAYEIPWSDTTVDLISNGGLTVAGWTGKSYEPSIELEDGTPGIELNQEVGSITVAVGPRETTVPVTSTGTISEPSLWWRLMNIF